MAGDGASTEMIQAYRFARRFGLCFNFGLALFDVADEQFELFDRAIELSDERPNRDAATRRVAFSAFDQQRLGVNLGRKRGDIALQIACDATQIIWISRQISDRRRHVHF